MATDMTKHFTLFELLKLSVPCMATTLFASVYAVVDGLFVVNCSGKEAFAAINIVMPVILILGSAGFMIGAGGSALVLHAQGAGKTKFALESFTLLTVFTFLLGVLCAALGYLFMPSIAYALGARDNLYEMALVYGRISMSSLAFYMVQYAFQPLFSAAGKPGYGFLVTLVAGLSNIVLDAVFVAMLNWGVAGAAWATAISEFVGGGIPLVYFMRKHNSSHFRFTRFSLRMSTIAKACSNGSSEMISLVSVSLAGMLYNIQLLSYIGADGVAAYGTLLYVGWLFSALFGGFAIASSPLMSFAHGSANLVEKQSLLKKSLLIMAVLGILMTLIAYFGSYYISCAFSGGDSALQMLTEFALRIYAFSFLVMGISIYGSSLFTSLGNGFVSAIISLVRTLVLGCGAVLLLPVFLGVNGIWLSCVVSEIISALFVAVLIYVLGPQYQLRSA